MGNTNLARRRAEEGDGRVPPTAPPTTVFDARDILEEELNNSVVRLHVIADLCPDADTRDRIRAVNARLTDIHLAVDHFQVTWFLRGTPPEPEELEARACT